VLPKKTNPIILLLAGVVLTSLIFLAESQLQFFWLSLVLFLGMFIQPDGFKNTFLRLKSYFFYLFFMFGIYVIFTIFLTHKELSQILPTIGLSIFRLFLMMVTLSLVLSFINSDKLIDAFRTMWLKTGIKSRKVEDFFQLTSLILRFFPTFTQEVKLRLEVSKMLGIPTSKSIIESAKSKAKILPGLILNCLRRADILEKSMRIRGYGNHIPRSLANPVYFTSYDLFFVISLFLFIGGFSSLA
tara:strand:+ start:337 stop:1065 length:729 start_codon:yes stop_codon:yes gene_type:complete